MLVSYASQNFITKLEFKCLQSNLNIKEFSWAQLPRRKSPKVISSINILFSNARTAKLHSLPVFIDRLLGVSTLDSEENRHSTRADV